MPTYVAKCLECGNQHDFIRTVSTRDDTPSHCDKPMARQGAWAVAPAVGAMNWTGHAGFAHGSEWIEDGQAYKKFLKKHNYVPESEGTQEAVIQAANKAQADDRKLEAAVTQAVLTHK